MKSPIVKTFIGRHIDLSKIVSISDAEFINRMGSGGWFVGFEIHIQLLDNPIVYRRGFDDDEYIYISEYTQNPPTRDAHGNKLKKGHNVIYGSDRVTPLAVERLQAQIDDLIEQWRQVRLQEMEMHNELENAKL